MTNSFQLACTLAMLCGLTFSARAQQNDTERSAAKLITPQAEQAIQRGLAFLVSQQHEDGSFGSGQFRGNVGITALAGMAMMADGSTPGRGPHGRQLAQCLDYLLAHAQESGLINSPAGSSHGPMYGHGFATMFIADCYGMSPRPELREKLAKAVNLIVRTQNREGGWRYQPRPDDADISVTVCEIMALRAARNAGLHVPKDTIDRSIAYVKRCQNPDGGFMYMLTGGPSAFPRSAAGVVALYSAGVYEGPEIQKGLHYVMKFLPRPAQTAEEPYFHYGHYYAVQAMWHAGGDDWNRWYPAVCDDLVRRQQKDGSWTSSISVQYASAMSCIVLQAPNNCLPILQR